ncbi:MAG: hypothetical protein EU529_03105 [Promethearchaeota archaeon]|nr:MAG: hypothetical protein EU529_03105 [Candidatus Lokiarchaeota archaeon]
MNQSTKKNKKRIFIFLIIFVGLTFTNIAAINLLSFSGIPSTEDDTNDNIIQINDDKPKLAEYERTVEDTGNDINITLHQSINNMGDPLYEIVDFNSVANRSFEIDSPIDTDFNSSYTEIKVEDIYAPNKTLELESANSDTSSNLGSGRWFGSFVAPSNCIMTNASFLISNVWNGITITIYLINSTNTGEPYNPSDFTPFVIGSFNPINFAGNRWYSVDFTDQFLNNTLTYDNKWYIGLTKSVGAGGEDPFWIAGWDSTDSIDNSDSYRYSSGTYTPFAIDYRCDMKLVPTSETGSIDNKPAPVAINMEINGTGVVNGDENAGTWFNNTALPSSNNQLNFTLDAGWWDVTCNITMIQVNYTKTSICGIANFTVTANQPVVRWNVTMSEVLDDFEDKFKCYYINYTIPSHWGDVEVWNGTTQMTRNVTRSLGTGYDELQIFEAGNGTNWFLTANNTNLLAESLGGIVHTYVSKNDVSFINFTNIVDINITLIQNITQNNGEIITDVFENNPPDYDENYTSDRSTFEGTKEINATIWYVNSTVDVYGHFIVQVGWLNGTAVAFGEKNITVLGETELTIEPLAVDIFDSNEIFNITINSTDIGKKEKFDPDEIIYSLDDGVSWSSKNITVFAIGQANITINCSDVNGYGPQTIIINMSSQYYHNQSETVTITILALTELIFMEPTQFEYDSNEEFKILFEYRDKIRDSPVNADQVNYSIESYNWRNDNIDNYGVGLYNISILCNDSEFDDYGEKTILVHINRTYYHNQTVEIKINITGVTDMYLVGFVPPYVYNSDGSFDIFLYFNDTSRNTGIEGATIEYRLNNTGAQFRTDNWVDLGGGNYRITVYCNTSEFYPYGEPIITIHINKTFYINQSLSTSPGDITIRGVTDMYLVGFVPPYVYNSDGSFDIFLYFNDTVRNTGIEGATIEYRLNNTGAQFRTDNWVDLGGGNYRITVYCNTSEFYPYGEPIITIHINKTYYINQSLSTSPGEITIIGVTEASAVADPFKLGYESNELFNVTIYFNDKVRDEGITDADLVVDVNGTQYYPYIFDNGDGYYNITVNCSDPIFSGMGYGNFIYRVNISKHYYENKTREVEVYIGAATNLTLDIFPIKASYDSGETFNITAFYQDVGTGDGVDGAAITVRINNQIYAPLDFQDFLDGYYNITIECNAPQFGNYGTATVKITASKTNYNPSENITSVDVIGETSFSIQKVPDDLYYSSSNTFNITAYFYDITRNQGINGSSISLYVEGTEYDPLEIFDNGDGYYYIKINCSADVFNPYDNLTIRVNASKIYYYNKTDTLKAFIVGNTTLTVLSPSEYVQIVQGTTFNITVNFEDVELITGVAGAFINYTLNGTGYRIDKCNDNGDGTYNITIDIDDPDFGIYGIINITIIASKYAYINRSINFTIHRQIQTSLNPPGTIVDLGSIFRSQHVNFTFNYSDTNFKPIRGALWDIVENDAGFTPNWVELGDGEYNLTLDSTGVFAQVASYNFIFNISAIGNETQEITLIIRVLLPKTRIDLDNNIIGLIVPIRTNITLKFNFTDDLRNERIESITTENVSIEILSGAIWNDYNESRGGDPNFANGAWELFNLTKGQYILRISTLNLDKFQSYTIRITISYTSTNPGPYNDSIIEITNFLYGEPIDISSDGGGDDGGVTTGIAFEDLLLWIIIIAAAVGGIIAIVGIQKGIIAPKKREKERVLREVTTIFDDAVNLEHLLVIFKGTGTCVFFKSYGMEEIDPELISGFLTAVSSFGREMDSQQALNEIQYGDKMLLLADGEHVRVALVLDKQASVFLRQHLKEFIENFEAIYANSLINFRGQIDVFSNAGEHVDNVFQTSIILPHEISPDIGKIKSLKGPHSKDVLKIARRLIKGSERKFFFIATLLTEAIERTDKDKAEVFMGIKELRDKKVLSPIQISAIEGKEVSQQELNMIRQQVCTLPGLSEEEINRLVNDLARKTPAEREAYLVSCREKEEIVSAPIKTTTIGEKVIDSPKSAKKEIKNLKKAASVKLKEGDLKTTLEIYRSAAVIATDWGLQKEAENLENTTRVTQINGLNQLKNILEKEAKKAEKNKDYATAAEKYKKASKTASEIFKLGVTEMYSEVKKLTKKSNELEKLI